MKPVGASMTKHHNAVSTTKMYCLVVLGVKSLRGVSKALLPLKALGMDVLQDLPGCWQFVGFIRQNVLSAWCFLYKDTSHTDMGGGGPPYSSVTFP